MLSWFNREPESERPPLHALGWVAIAFLIGPVAWWITIVLILVFDYPKYIFFLYLGWMFWDRRSDVSSGRRWKWVRQWSWWKHHRDYFPIKLVKTCEIPSDRNYLFAIFPHGVVTLGGMTTFGTDVLDFEGTFPGIKLTLCTLSIIFRMPILREIALGFGFRSVSEESLNEILQSPQKGMAAGVVVGGAAEAGLSKPGEYKVLLSRRKGFCKIALQNGCDIVPVYSFGESDVYDLYEPEEGSLLSKFQLWVKSVTTIFPVIFRGIGLFGLFPRRIPITVTVGKPIQVRKAEAPTKEDIEQLHGLFKEGLIRLFDDNKSKYLGKKDAKLIIC